MERRPLYARVAAELRSSIVDGEHPPGALLPSEGELAARHGVSRGTVRHAVSVLAAEGCVASRQGARSVVLAAPRMQSFGHLLSFSAWARSLGAVPRGRMVELRRRRAGPADAEQLGIEPGDEVYALVRVRLLEARPVMIERTTFIESVGVLLGSLRLEVDSIYERLAERGVVRARPPCDRGAGRRRARRGAARGAGGDAAAASGAAHDRARRHSPRTLR